MQLQGRLDDFHRAGFGVVLLTYDAPEVQRAFAAKAGITIPMLSDIDAASGRALGVLNAEYPPGSDNHGLPYPGAFVVDPQGVIRGKQFLLGYETRVDAAAVLAYAISVAGGAG